MNPFIRVAQVFGCMTVLLLCTSAVEAQLVRDPAAIEAYDAGTKLLGEEKWDDAITEFTKAVDIDKTYAEAYLGRGEALRELEDYSTAIQSYKSALDIDPKLAKAYNGRGVCYREAKLYDLALNDFDNAIQLDRHDSEIAANLGDMYVNHINDPTSGLRVLDKAIELDPNNAEAYRNRGLAHAQLRHWDDAEADLAKSAELKNDDYKTYETQATIYLFQDKPEKLPLAVEALGNAIKYYKPEDSSDPKTYIQGYLQRSNSLLKMAVSEKTPEAERKQLLDQVVADADAVLAELPDSYPVSGQALLIKGKALRLQNLYGEAIKAITDALQQIPPGEQGSYAADAYLKRGICWHLQDENRLARGDFQQAASLDYADPLPHLWMGYTYAEEGDYRSAIDAYGEAIAKNPSFALPYVNRGLSYAQLGEFQRAADNFVEAIRAEPLNADNFVKRGDAYMLLEKYEKAFNSYHDATLRDDKNSEAFRKAAVALKMLGRDSLSNEYESRAKELEAQNG